MKYTEEVSISYKGKDVDNGSMSINDMVDALQGFNNAYLKVAAFKKIATYHHLRISGLKKGSANIIITILEHIADHADQIQIGGIAVSGISGVLAIVLKLIKLMKHIGNDMPTVNVKGDGNIVVINGNNVSQEFPLDVWDIYNKKLLARDLNRITAPLEDGKIDSASISSKKDGEIVEESITAKEKKYFDYVQEETTVIKETTLTGTMISLNKERHNGTFHLQDGTRIPYRIVTETPETMYQFFLHDGSVNVKCKVHLDQNLKPISMEISDITYLQGNLGLD